MTDEERQELCAVLRMAKPIHYYSSRSTMLRNAGEEAAKEMEALVKERDRWREIATVLQRADLPEQWEWQDPPSWINGPTKVRAGNAVTAKALKDFK